MAAATDPSQQPVTGVPGGDLPLAERVVEALLFTPFEIAGSLAAQPIKQWNSASKQVRQEISNARVIGKLALTFGAKRLRSDIEQRLGGSADSTTTARPATTSSRRAQDAPTASTGVAGESTPGAAAAAPAATVDDDAAVTSAMVDADDLALPDYDSLAASNIVQMLGGLTSDELDAVEIYERAHRARRTVLGKVMQLRDELGADRDD